MTDEIKSEGRELFDKQVAAELATLSKDEVPKEEVKKEEVVVETKESVDPELEEALKNGYDPNFKGPNKVSPYEFNRFGKMLSHQHQLKDEIKSLKDTVKGLAEHARSVEKAAYTKALNELENRRVQAIQEGDLDSVQKIERETAVLGNQINDLEKTTETKVDAVKAVEYEKTQVEKDFEKRNEDWFNTNTVENEEMANFAIAKGRTLANRVARGEIQMTPEEMVAEVESVVKKVYSHRFKNVNKDQPMAVGKSTTSSEDGGKPSLGSRLNERQLAFWKQAHREDPKFTKEVYAKQLELIGAL